MTPADTREARRIQLGDQLSLVFEGPETLSAVPGDAVAALRPEGAGLLAVLYLDVAQAGELGRATAANAGAEHALYLDIGGTRATGLPLTGQGDSAEPTAAWAVWFPLTDSQRGAWLEGAEVAVGGDRAGIPRVHLTPEQRRTLAADI
ncbi:MAG: hypothetical protein JOZ46_09705 [Candidatus Dormibacteraeota bacterium]|nr:hypothetical protein [Candidatus Dormibacteraeota bacterium]MBV9526071.1 hypothetical protein [Candidatus Dormibacteraeota bacterium]